MPTRCRFILLILVLIFTAWSLPALADMIVDTAWVRRYNGSGDSTDEACAIAVDDSGSVYVTGTSIGWGNFPQDYITVKYYPNGDTAWVRRFDGFSHQDIASAIVVDSYRNVYVTGESQGHWKGSSMDYATIKYTPDGQTVWVKRYSGPVDSWDRATAIAVDSSGNVYVTGFSSQSSGWPLNKDYATIKYYPNGDTAWVRRYNGPGNQDDCASAIAVDDSGNVYVTGNSAQNNSPPYNMDITTIKYTSNGYEQWIQRYDGLYNLDDFATDLVVDRWDNIYVSGYSGERGSGGYCIIKYSPNGGIEWVSTFGNPWDETNAVALALDHQRYLCFTGWYYSGSYQQCDYMTKKYHFIGNEIWSREYNGPANYLDRATDIAVDDSSNVYVTGWSYGINTEKDYATVKYGPDGNRCWVIRYNGMDDSTDVPVAIAVDDFGSIVVTGYSYTNGSDFDYTTIKYVETSRVRGDLNDDSIIDLEDVVYLVKYLYANGVAPDPLEAGNANCDELIDMEDVVYLINYLFKSGPAPSC
jgi:hypothetical protein